MRSTEWFDGVDLDSEAASGGSTSTPGGSALPATPGGAGVALDPDFGLGPGPSGAGSGLLGAHDASAPGLDLVLLRGWPSPAGCSSADRDAESSGAREAAPERAAEQAGDSGSSRRGADALPAGVSMVIASAAGEHRVDITTTSVQMHMCLEVRIMLNCAGSELCERPKPLNMHPSGPQSSHQAHCLCATVHGSRARGCWSL